MNPSSVNNFFGQKLSSQGVNVSGAGDKQLLWKDDYDANLKTWYGTNGPIMEQGKLTQNPDSYGLEIVNPSNGNPIANYGEQTDGTVNLKFFDSNGVGVAQFGQFPDGSIALKVAKPGEEVSTATDAQLIFNSGQNIFKIVLTGTATIPSSTSASTGGTNTVTVAHNLGFVPANISYIVDPTSGGYTALPFFPQRGTLQRNFSNPNNGIVLAQSQYVYATADDTNINFYTDWANGVYPAAYTTPSYTVKYYLLQESAN